MVTEERLRVRIGNEQVHYMDGLAAGALVLQLFGDAAGCLGIRREGIGGLLAGYDKVDILYPIHVGDLVEVVARLEKVGNTSRKIALEAFVHLSRFDEQGEQGRWHEFDPPMLAARALATSVVRKEHQYGGPIRIDGSRRGQQGA